MAKNQSRWATDDDVAKDFEPAVSEFLRTINSWFDYWPGEHEKDPAELEAFLEHTLEKFDAMEEMPVKARNLLGMIRRAHHRWTNHGSTQSDARTETTRNPTRPWIEVNDPALVQEFGIFFIVDGVKIAKFGGPNEERIWIPIEPGWSVVEDEHGVLIRFDSDSARRAN
jgi:hypothetical protein